MVISSSEIESVVRHQFFFIDFVFVCDEDFSGVTTLYGCNSKNVQYMKRKLC